MLKNLFILVAILLGNSPDLLAQLYHLDSSFQSILVKRNTSFVTSFIKQSDNKLLVLGGLDYVNNVEKLSPVRLNEDGSFDDSFSLSWLGGKSSLALRGDGKIIGHDFVNGANGEANLRLLLFKPNGQLDSTFTTDIKSATIISQKALAVQKDNKVVVGTVILQDDHTYKGLINRVKTDGSIDSTFNTTDLTISWIRAIYLQADGKILVTGSFGPNENFQKKIIRLHSDGSLDSSFDPPLSGFGGLNTLTFQEDGKILLGTDHGVVRLLATGQLDESFTIIANDVHSIALQPDGKILAGCWVKTTNAYKGYGPVIRLNADGSIDASFDAGQGAVDHPIDALVVQSNGQILAGGFFDQFNGQSATGIVRLNVTDGQIDSTFSIKLESRGHLEQTVAQPDGRLLIFGDFNSADDRSSNDIARLNKDGSLDDSFNIGTGVDGFWSINGGHILAVALQQDQKILVGGYFSSFNSVSANSLLRLNKDGSVDQDFKKFELEDFQVHTIAVQNDGKILVGGNGSFGTKTKFLNRLLPDGSLDPDFVVGEGIGTVAQILIQEDGKVLVSGNFISYNNVPTNYIVRLNPDGTVDQTFQVNGLNNYIKKIVLQNDGKILILGEFTEFNNVLVNNLIRLNADGSFDETFNPEFGTNPQLQDFVLQSDGQILVSGRLFQGSKKLVLLENDGSLNDEFFVLEFDHSTYRSMTSVDNKLLIVTGNKLIQLYTLQQQSITFDTIPDKFVNDPPFTLNATASSRLPITFKIISGPATVEGNVVTLTEQPWLVTIQALQEGDENYLPAEEVIRSFVVKEATFTLSGKVKTEAGDLASSGAVILYTPNEADRLTTFKAGVLENDGSYAFTGLKEGSYSVGVIPDDPAFLTTYLGDVVIRSEATLILLSQNTENQDINLISQTETLTGNATISGILFLEENNGGSRILTGAAEVEGMPLPEVAVYLINASGDVVAHEVTDAEGKFSFTNVAAGSYQFKADYEGMPHDTDNFSIEVSEKDMEVTALVAKEGIIRVQEVSVVTGTGKEIIQAPVLLYPNPTEGKFTILLDAYWRGSSLIIHNMSGQPIAQKPIHSSKLTFDLSQEKAGIYAITLQKGESYQILRVNKL